MDMMSALDRLAGTARADLAALAYPDRAWVPPARTEMGEAIHAVVIVGAGQSGLASAFALRRDGVHDVVLLDRAEAGREGVWDSFARMEELRTPKSLNGMELGCPSLSVAAWYAARHGAQAWAALTRIPRRDWMDYLRWYRSTLGLAVENGVAITDIRPHDTRGDILAVHGVEDGRTRRILARTVLIATGHDGGGDWRVPDFVRNALPPERYDHTNGPVAFDRLAGRRVAVLGHGASAFDNANAALAAGAARVDLCFRRARLPRVNPHRHLETAGTLTHFPRLDDASRWRVARHFRAVDQPPPPRGFAQALADARFHLHPGRPWTAVALSGDEIAIDTPRGTLLADHLLLATGHAIDLAARPELATLAGRVALWRERYVPPQGEEDERLGAHPYLAPDFAFLPRRAEDGWVARVFCFNGASVVSHGPHSTSISGHRHAVPRVVRGVTARLFDDAAPDFVETLVRYDEADLVLPEDFERSQILRDAAI